MFTETNSSIKSLTFGIYRKLATIVLVVVATLLNLTTDSANADVTVTWSDDGTDITATYSGIFDLSPYPNGERFSNGPTHFASSDSSETNFYSLIGTAQLYQSSTPNFLGSGRFDHGILTGGSYLSSSGDAFTFSTWDFGSQINVPQGYVSNSALNGSVTWSGATVSSVFGSGLDSPADFYDDGTNQVTYAISAAAVPEPTTFGLIGLASLGLGLTRRRRS